MISSLENAILEEKGEVIKFEQDEANILILQIYLKIGRKFDEKYGEEDGNLLHDSILKTGKEMWKTLFSSMKSIYSNLKKTS